MTRIRLIGILFFLTAISIGSFDQLAFGGNDTKVVRQSPGKPRSRPNVILIFTDDQGTLDLNCYGSKDLHTPHLDKLAEKGILFKQFYVAAPVCSPSRAALITGRYPQRAGVPGNVPSTPGGTGMPLPEVTLAELLGNAGYRTGLVGKWHLGTANSHDPLAQGFQEFFGHKAGCIDNYSHFFYWRGAPYHDLWRNRKEIHEDGKYFGELVKREALSFIEKHKEHPFFLYVPMNSPHYPMQAPQEYFARYEKLKEPRRSYAAMVSFIDDAVGSIVAKVEELGLRENTIIIFLSDHGHSTEIRCNSGGGNPGPFRGSKFSLFEAGVRVPCLISWPGHLPEGESRDQMAMSIDWYPTIAELCQVKLLQRKIDGKSLVPLLISGTAKTPHQVLHWQLGKQWAVRSGDWKLVVNGRRTGGKKKEKAPDRIFLGNLAKDISERKNFAKAHPEVVQRLTQLHNEWAAQWKQR